MSENPFESIQQGICEQAMGTPKLSEFYLYEPWDVTKREDWFRDEVKADGVKWDDEGTQRVYGTDPHIFQSGFHYVTADEKLIAVMLAATQVGKSYPALIDIIITLTGELPVAFRHPKGYQTDIKRNVSRENVRRWGRFDAATGILLDHDEKVEPSPTWDCGCIVGCGEYPVSNMCDREGDQVWVGTFKQASDTMWIPRLKTVIPKHLLNTRRYDDGFEAQKHIFHFSNGRQLHIITYEQDYKRFEARKVKMIVLDEEPPDRRIFAAALSHCERLRICMTPYNGITWMYHDILKTANESNVAIFHATAYDNPYDTRKLINEKKQKYKRYEIAARVYGLFASQADKPYFNIDQLMPMKNRFVSMCELMRLSHTFPDRFKIEKPNPMLIETDLAEKVDMRDVVEVYERPEKGTAYWISCDTSDGAETAQAAADHLTAYVMRPPKGDEGVWPQMCACLHSTLPVRAFAAEVLKLATWFNLAMLAPESRGETGAYFVADTREWNPYFKMNVVRDSDKKETERLGFYTSPSSRKMLCELLTNYLQDSHENKVVLPYRHYKLLEEHMAAITSDKGRMDHPETGRSDCLICFAIGLYVWRFAFDQVRLVQAMAVGYNAASSDGISPALRKRMPQNIETRPVLGGRGLDARERRIVLREGTGMRL